MGNRRFSLSAPDGRELPQSVSEGGSSFSIRPSYWNVLRILRMLNDPEVPDWHKPVLLNRWFYADADALPNDPAGAFRDFLLCGEEPEPGRPDEENRICYEFDAPEIYAAFLSEYGIDLLERRDLHWWRFSALLKGAMRTKNALSVKLELRTLDPSKCEDPAKAEQIKRSVQIPAEASRADRALEQELTVALLSGGDVEKVLERLRNGI